MPEVVSLFTIQLLILVVLCALNYVFIKQWWSTIPSISTKPTLIFHMYIFERKMYLSSLQMWQYSKHSGFIDALLHWNTCWHQCVILLLQMTFQNRLDIYWELLLYKMLFCCTKYQVECYWCEAITSLSTGQE